MKHCDESGQARGAYPDHRESRRPLHPRTDRESRFWVNLLGNRIVVNALNIPDCKTTPNTARATLTVSRQALVRSLRRPCSPQRLCPFVAHPTQLTLAQAHACGCTSTSVFTRRRTSFFRIFALRTIEAPWMFARKHLESPHASVDGEIETPDPRLAIRHPVFPLLERRSNFLLTRSLQKDSTPP